MKKLICILLLATLNIASFAQVTLSREQLASLPEETKQQITKVSENPPSKYVGLGKEIGEAINSSLNSIEKHAISFSNTKLGKITVFVLLWKLLYRDIIRGIIGITLLILFIITLRKILKFIKEDDSKNDDKTSSFLAVGCVTEAILFVSTMLTFFA